MTVEYYTTIPFVLQDIIGSVLLVLVYVAGGVAIAYYASVWSSSPDIDGCDTLRDLEIMDPCSTDTHHVWEHSRSKSVFFPWMEGLKYTHNMG